MAFDDDQTNQPLAGAVLCCTSILADVRTKLADAARQMGATLSLDLTSDVTHLLVGKIDTPKYRYVAKERPEVRVLHADWVDAVRAAWMAGDDCGPAAVAALERAHALPPFFGLKVCVTQFETVALQTYYAEHVVRGGGAFSGDLTRDVTHLVAAAPRGVKYTHAKHWGIHVVSAKWFEDSLKRGMALDEALYAPELPEEEQGIGAFRAERKPTRTSLGKRGRESEERGASTAAELGKRKMRRVASMRLEGHSQDLWQGISGQEVRAGKTRENMWQDEQPADENAPTAHENETQLNPNKVREGMGADTDEPRGLFAGHYILIHGFGTSQVKRIQDYLEPNGARVVQTAGELENASFEAFFQNRCLLTPHAASNEKTTIPDVPPGTWRITEWWVERCIHHKRLLDPQDDILSRPLGNILIPGFNTMLVSTTGFTGVDLRQIAEMVKLMGAEYQESLKPTTQILISASDQVKKEKAFYAAKHSIPVVRADWLWRSFKTQSRCPVDEYRIKLPADKLREVSQPSTSQSSAMQERAPRTFAKDASRADDQPKRLSSSRRRHATPSLTLQPSKPEASKHGPFIHEDDNDDDQAPLLDEATPAMHDSVATTSTPQPLGEISPNASPRKDSRDFQEVRADGVEKVVMRNGQSLRTDRNETPPVSAGDAPRLSAEADPAPRPSEHLSEQIALLMEQRRASRAASVDDTSSPQKRRRRPLGRNLSNLSNLANNNPIAVPARSNSGSRGFPADAHVSNSPADGFNFAPRVEEEAPSTQLGYETLETEAHRKRMSKRMGTDLQDDGTGQRIASLGTVKDSELIALKTAKERGKGRQRQQMKS